jgi:hypothetical protein
VSFEQMVAQLNRQERAYVAAHPYSSFRHENAKNPSENFTFKNCIWVHPPTPVQVGSACASPNKNDKNNCAGLISCDLASDVMNGQTMIKGLETNAVCTTSTHECLSPGQCGADPSISEIADATFRNDQGTRLNVSDEERKDNDAQSSDPKKQPAPTEMAK